MLVEGDLRRSVSSNIKDLLIWVATEVLDIAISFQLEDKELTQTREQEKVKRFQLLVRRRLSNNYGF